jgi:hypothetical protein
MDEQELIEIEKEAAVQALTYLANGNLEAASKSKDEGCFKMTFGLSFQRSAGPTVIKARVRYTKTVGEDLELHCRDSQLELDWVKGADGPRP